ncbi:MAG: PEP-CTERM sorting domain-containing protein [Desulfobulbus sp.]|jgi:hypothetical protein
MKKKLITGLAVLAFAATAQAGPYSPGKGGPDEAGYIDAGIAGFVGPAGLGVTATDSNGNYVNPVFTAWATRVVEYTPSDTVGVYGMNGIGPAFADPTKALGPVTGSNMDIVSLGDMDSNEISAYLAGTGPGPGVLTLGFDVVITNGPGADFAAFENGFVSNYSTGAGTTSGEMFAELGYVSVSTDGINFATFPSTYLNYPDAPPASQGYLTQDVSNVHNLVGKHANAYGVSWGTPFDLDDLVDDPLVLSGLVDLDAIHYVRITDIPGDGTWKDAHGNAIYDAWVTWGSGGLDFEALGVINQQASPVPAPGAIWLVGAGVIALSGLGRRRAA